MDAGTTTTKQSGRLKSWLLGASGASLGLLASVAAPSTTACVAIPNCITFESPGTDWCRNMANAKTWKLGDDPVTESIPLVDGNGNPPQGCECFNDLDDFILLNEAPTCLVDDYLEAISSNARMACLSLVQSGWDSNCVSPNGAGSAASPEDAVGVGNGACIGSCSFTDECEGEPPKECDLGGTGGYGGQYPECEDTGTGGPIDDADSDSGDSSGGVELESWLYITCTGTSCDIDEDFAQMLYDEPELLVHEDARLEFDDTPDRFVFKHVDSRMVAHELGFRTDDVLEKINGVIIDDIDAGLEVFVASANDTVFNVRVKRGTLWKDFTFTID